MSLSLSFSVSFSAETSDLLLSAIEQPPLHKMKNTREHFYKGANDNVLLLMAFGRFFFIFSYEESVPYSLEMIMEGKVCNESQLNIKLKGIRKKG